MTDAGTSDELLVERTGGVLTLTLNRPHKRNALSLSLRAAVAAALRGAAAEADELRCVLITGAGTAFCAGMDTSQFGGDAANRRAIVETSEALFDALLEHPVPILAAVNGPAMGGGFALALVCDMRIAGASASFGFPEVKRGIPASYGAARAALPPGIARELCMTGGTVDAAKALRLGIVSEIVRDDQLRARGAAKAAEIADLPPLGLRMLKQWIREADVADARSLLALEREALRAAVLGSG